MIKNVQIVVIQQRIETNLSTDSLPRKGSSMYSFMQETNKSQNKMVKRFRLLNKFLVVPLYRIYFLPIFQIGRIILLLYTKGRKSGKTRITPLEFRRYNGKILIFSARGKYGDWYKNILADPTDLRIKIGFRKYSPKVQTTDFNEKLEILKWYMKSFPRSAKELFGYEKKKDTISDELIDPVARFIEIFQLEI